MELIKTKRANGSYRVAIRSDAPSKTEKRHGKACNINTIMAKIRKGSAITLNKREPQYGNFATTGDFFEAQNKVLEAHHEFNQLPAEVRRRFANDPGNLLQAIEDSAVDPEIRSELTDLGILARPVPVDVPKEIDPPTGDETPKTGV